MVIPVSSARSQQAEYQCISSTLDTVGPVAHRAESNLSESRNSVLALKSQILARALDADEVNKIVLQNDFQQQRQDFFFVCLCV